MSQAARRPTLIPPDDGGFRRTWLVEGLEAANRFRLPIYLKRRYYRDGWSYGAISDELGCSEATVARWMRQLGLTLRQVAFASMAGDPELRSRPPLRVVGREGLG